MDVVTLGESMLRLSPPPGACLESAASYNVFIAGAESNAAIALSRLGLRTAWVSKLPQTSLGRKAWSLVRQHGVDTSRITWSESGRMGLYFIDLGIPPRNADVLYDRAGSAFSTITPDEVDWRFVTSGRALYLTGITPALSEGCRQVVSRALQEARSAGVITTFDMNYRARLWPPDRARQTIEPMLRLVDVFCISAEDADLVLGVTGEARDTVAEIARRYGNSTVVLTLGAEGAVACHGDSIFSSPAVEGIAVDVVGRGDAFWAGFLYGYLQSDIQRALEFGCAMASLKQTFAGDITWVTRQDVEQVLVGRKGVLHR